MNTETTEIEATSSGASQAASPTKPLLAAIRVGGGSPLHPRAVEDYMERQRVAHSSPRWFLWIVDRLPGEHADSNSRIGVGDALVLGSGSSFVLALACAALGVFWHGLFAFAGVSLAVALGFLLVFVGLAALGNALYVRARRATWRVADLESFAARAIRYGDPLHWAEVDGPIPSCLLGLVQRIRERAPGATFAVHYLDADPVLEVSGDDERYYLGVWDEDCNPVYVPLL